MHFLLKKKTRFSFPIYMSAQCYNAIVSCGINTVYWFIYPIKRKERGSREWQNHQKKNTHIRLLVGLQEILLGFFPHFISPEGNLVFSPFDSFSLSLCFFFFFFHDKTTKNTFSLLLVPKCLGLAMNLNRLIRSATCISKFSHDVKKKNIYFFL